MLPRMIKAAQHCEKILPASCGRRFRAERPKSNQILIYSRLHIQPAEAKIVKTKEALSPPEQEKQSAPGRYFCRLRRRRLSRERQVAMAKILIVEDEAKIARFVELELKYEGYEVEIANDGRTGLDLALHSGADLVLLDIMLPGLSGIEVCRRVRTESEIPIIMLTAKDDVTDKVAGLDMGADDYMTKPFAIEELLARIRVALNRHAKKGGTAAGHKKDELVFGLLSLNVASHSAYYGEEELALTKKEYELLEYLLKNKNIAVTREQLLNNVWGYEYFGDTNVVDVYIRYLRQKIDDRFGVRIISTVRGVGYIIKDER